MLKLRAKNFIEASKGIKEEEPIVPQNELVQAASTLALDTDSTAKLAFSAVLIYSILYVCERAIWTLTAGEQQFKSQFVEFASRSLPLLEDNLVDSVRQQVHRELTTILGVACGSVEVISETLKMDKDKLTNDVEVLQETIEVSQELISNGNDIEEKLERLLEMLE